MRFLELSIPAIPYNDTLNPLLWEDDHLKTEIRYKLMFIAKHFAQFLNVSNLNLEDSTISGSNASFGYSDYSDIDLHLVVKMPPDNPDLAELYNAKKNQYNFKYDLSVKGIAVELYVQDGKQPHQSAGIYSILNDTWVIKPKHQTPVVKDAEVKSKARNYASKINQALQSSDLKSAQETLDDLSRLRKAGLEQGGEFSIENLAFKLLRSRGKIDKLRKHVDTLQSKELSLGEKYED